MPESAFIIRVPEAEASVSSLRERFDPSARRGVPAHVTVLAPFMSPELIDAQVLEAAQTALNEVHAFNFLLRNIGRFHATAYLAPEPVEPFIALTQAIYRRFPQFPPNRGEYPDVVPHLTVATGVVGEAAIAAEELLAIMRQRGPIHASCHSVGLLENSSARWQSLHEFALPRLADAGRTGRKEVR